PLPNVGDDFDWLTRDYDGFRLFMMEELAARMPERARWTPADLEVVLVEALAAVLDQLSDRADRVAAEAYLETARRPESVRRWRRGARGGAVRAAGARGGRRTGRGVPRLPADDGGRSRRGHPRDPRSSAHGHRRGSRAATRAPPGGAARGCRRRVGRSMVDR